MVSRANLQKETTSTERMLACPLCGAPLDENRLNELGVSSELLAVTQELKEQQMLAEGIFVAAKIVKTANHDPIMFNRLLDEKSGAWIEQIVRQVLEGVSRETKPLQQTLSELKGSPLVGKIQEIALPKRLKAVALTDEFTGEKSTKAGEDVLAKVRENNVDVGKIVIESKYVKSWSNSFVEQIKGYMKHEDTTFGIIATTTMPDDAISYTTIIDDVVIVKAEYAEVAYLFMRECLKTKRALEEEYASKLGQLKVKEQVMYKIREAIMNGALDEIIKNVGKCVDEIDDQVIKTENYLVNRVFPAIREATTKIRELMANLVHQHIQKIRLQLEESILRSA